MSSIFFKQIIKIAIFKLALLFLCANCTQPAIKIEDNGIQTIDITRNISKTQKLNLSTIASSIDYCPLETNENCLIPDYGVIYSSGYYFVYMSGEADCYIFERKTGKFVRQISQRGQGPNDYQYTVKVLDGDKGQILLDGNNQLLFFNLDGTLSHKTKVFAYNFIAYKDYYVYYVANRRGNATIRIAFCNITGELIDSIPNNRFYKRIEGTSTSAGGDFSFHLFDNSLYYKDIYCDTLYQIKDFSLEPRYIFNTGGRAVPYESQNEGGVDVQAMMEGRENDRYAKYIVINKFFESTNFLFFTFDYRNRTYQVIYNKSEDKIQIMPPVTHPITYLRDRELPISGFENDLDGGFPFWPQQMISEREMMCVYTAEELLSLDASKITDEKLKNLLNSLVEDDNPVVAIVTLKD